LVGATDRPAERARLAAAAHETGRQYDIDAFVRKMERLYVLLNEVSRPSRRRGVLAADLSFLTVPDAERPRSRPADRNGYVTTAGEAPRARP
jgi:hypothetical protein